MSLVNWWLSLSFLHDWKLAIAMGANASYFESSQLKSNVDELLETSSSWQTKSGKKSKNIVNSQKELPGSTEALRAENKPANERNDANKENKPDASIGPKRLSNSVAETLSKVKGPKKNAKTNVSEGKHQLARSANSAANLDLQTQKGAPLNAEVPGKASKSVQTPRLTLQRPRPSELKRAVSATKSQKPVTTKDAKKTTEPEGEVGPALDRSMQHDCSVASCHLQVCWILPSRHLKHP